MHEAKSYSTSSYAWRSILQTQHLLTKGLKWTVKNGKTIRVWKDNWIRSKQFVPAQGAGAVSHPHIEVNDLFINGTREWNRRLIESLFESVGCSICPQH